MTKPPDSLPTPELWLLLSQEHDARCRGIEAAEAERTAFPSFDGTMLAIGGVHGERVGIPTFGDKAMLEKCSTGMEGEDWRRSNPVNGSEHGAQRSTGLQQLGVALVLKSQLGEEISSTWSRVGIAAAS